mgnify:CR=1 FL=1
MYNTLYILLRVRIYSIFVKGYVMFKKNMKDILGVHLDEITSDISDYLFESIDFINVSVFYVLI